MGFGAGVGFSGEAAPSGAASPRAACGSSGPGAALEFFVLPPDPCWRRIWWADPGARRVLRLLPATATMAAEARRCAGTGGRSPGSFIDESSAATRRTGTAASLIGPSFP